MKESLNAYVDKVKKEFSFEFIQDIKIKESLYLFFGYSFMYFDEIKNDDLEEKLKELKAHTILIYIGSVVEAIVYHFVEKRLIDEKSKRKYLELKEFKTLYKVEKANIYLCELETKKVSLNDTKNFRALVNGLKDKHLLNEKLIEKIDYCRQMRNLIHIDMFSISELELINEITKALIYTKEIINIIKKELK
ncbi:MAG: hypothetical protein LBC61_01530 [Candidatus Peribacteria bacterium]|jgi:hypothetical protein|nr:hypothetical protein [Candidatus Peribacteria bacterium]